VRDEDLQSSTMITAAESMKVMIAGSRVFTGGR
jgi:hypothetical protein